MHSGVETVAHYPPRLPVLSLTDIDYECGPCLLARTYTIPVSRLRSSGTADKVLSQLELFSGWTLHIYKDPVPS
jgi:hypothetical protein